MDVVRSNLKKVGGSVDITTEKGKGTILTATLPQTLSIVTCLMIRTSKQLFALPQQNVVELILLDQKQVREVEGHEVYDLRGHLLPLLHLGKVLNLNDESSVKSSHIVVVRSERHHFGLLIDEVVNLEEIVVKRLGDHFAGLSFFSGAAIMGDGESVLILDVPGLARFTNLQANMNEDNLDDRNLSLEGVETGHLLFNVHGQQFGVNVATVPRIEKINASDIEVFMGIEVIRYRNEVVPVVRLEEVYDLEVEITNKPEFYVIIFNTDGMKTGIVASEINNVIDQLPPLDDHTFAGDSVKGRVILGENVTLIIDAIQLLRNLQSTRFKDITRHLQKIKSGIPESEVKTGTASAVTAG
jgi:two-component system, chemotaxis family, sensor kinase CheA